MRKQRTFTQDEMDTIKALYEEGIGIKIIAKGLHVDDKKVSAFVKDKYGPNSLQAGRKKNINSNPDRDIHLSVDMALAIATADDKETNGVPVLKVETPNKSVKVGKNEVSVHEHRVCDKPPVGNEWKPWMIPTEIIIPEDMSALNWTEYAKDYDRRKQICDERNAKLNS